MLMRPDAKEHTPGVIGLGGPWIHRTYLDSDDVSQESGSESDGTVSEELVVGINPCRQ